MDALELDTLPTPRPPRFLTVLGVLAAFSLLASWLIVYAATNALCAAGVVPPLPKDIDPRPKWLLLSFAGLFGGTVLLGSLFTWRSRRHLRQIDQIGEEEDTPAGAPSPAAPSQAP